MQQELGNVNDEPFPRHQECAMYGIASEVAVFLEKAVTRWHFLSVCDHLSQPPTTV
jgi:hypothetical protein